MKTKPQISLVLKKLDGMSNQFIRDERIAIHEKAAVVIYRKVKALAPVRTSTKIKKRYSKKRVVASYAAGNLKRSISVFKRKRGLIVIAAKQGGRGNSKGHFSGEKADGYYSHMVERGTKHSKAKPFFKPAFKATQNEAVKVLVNGYQDLLIDYLKK